MAKQISYSKRDFAALKQEQINYIKKYYPNLVENFNDGSILSVLLDLNAAIADNLHFHIDRALQETVLDYAQERKSLFDIAKTYGLKLPTKSASVAVCQFTIQVPVLGDAEDKRYLPIMYNGSQFSSDGASFELLYDVDFSSNVNSLNKVDRTKVPVYSNGILSAYQITKTGVVIAGATRIYTQVVNTTKPFYQITLPENNVLSVESIIHKNGTTFQTLPTLNEFNSNTNKWYEVHALVEDSIFVENKAIKPVNGVYAGEYLLTDRRYLKEFTPTGFCVLTFGSQTNEGLDILDDFIDAGTFNLAGLLNNNSLGMAPIKNTTLFIRYRIGGGAETNVGVGTINTVGQLIIKSDGPNAQTRSIVENSLRVINTTPAIGGGDAPSIEELRHYIAYNFAAQHRAVTLQDYKAILLGMPVKFGAPAKTAVTQIQNKINVNLLSTDSDGELSGVVSSVVMENVANYLSRYRMINDYVIIKPAEVIHLGFEISVLTEDGEQINVTSRIVDELINIFDKNEMGLGQNVLIGSIVKEVSKLDGVLDITSIRIFNKVGTNYSSNGLPASKLVNTETREIDASNGVISVAANQILQIRYPEKDIVVIPTIQNLLTL